MVRKSSGQLSDVHVVKQMASGKTRLMVGIQDKSEGILGPIEEVGKEWGKVSLWLKLVDKNIVDGIAEVIS